MDRYNRAGEREEKCDSFLPTWTICPILCNQLNFRVITVRFFFFFSQNSIWHEDQLLLWSSLLEKENPPSSVVCLSSRPLKSKAASPSLYQEMLERSPLPAPSRCSAAAWLNRISTRLATHFKMAASRNTVVLQAVVRPHSLLFWGWLLDK